MNKIHEDNIRANLLALQIALKKAKIHQVYIAYSGSGDSGQFEQAVLCDENLEDLSEGDVPEKIRRMKISMIETTGRWENGGWIHTTEVVGRTLFEAIDLFSNDWLEMNHAGWENNAGASGSITIYVEEGRVKMDHTEYYTESRQYDHELLAPSVLERLSDVAQGKDDPEL